MPLTPPQKTQILTTLITRDGSIVMENLQQDCKQIVIFQGKYPAHEPEPNTSDHPAGEFVYKDEFWYDNFSPRENATIEQRKLTLDEAWKLAEEFASDKINALAKQLGFL